MQSALFHTNKWNAVWTESSADWPPSDPPHAIYLATASGPVVAFQTKCHGVAADLRIVRNGDEEALPDWERKIGMATGMPAHRVPVRIWMTFCRSRSERMFAGVASEWFGRFRST